MIGLVLRNWRAIAFALLLAGSFAAQELGRRAGRRECEAAQVLDQAKAQVRASEQQEGLSNDGVRRDDALTTRRREIGAALVGAHQKADAAGDIDALFVGYAADVRQLRDDAAAAHSAAVQDFRDSSDP